MGLKGLRLILIQSKWRISCKKADIPFRNNNSMRGTLTLWLLHVHQYLVKDPDPSPHYAYCLMFAQEKQWFLLESISNETKVHKEDNYKTTIQHVIHINQ